MKESDFTMLYMEGRFIIILKATGETLHIGQGGISSADRWISDYIKPQGGK